LTAQLTKNLPLTALKEGIRGTSETHKFAIAHDNMIWKINSIRYSKRKVSEYVT
jgi:hypothetical protein